MKINQREIDIELSNGTRLMITDYGPLDFSSVHAFIGNEIVATIHCHPGRVDIKRCVPVEREVKEEGQ